MRDRFTRKSRIGRGRIPPEIRGEIFRRDDFTCQYCATKLPAEKLTIDHLVPISLGGLDEMTNYVTSCLPCNQRKSNQSLKEFAPSIKVPVELLPVHGDPIIDNEEIPLQIRQLRKSILDRIRLGQLRIRGTASQKKIEKTYRMEFWNTEAGKALEDKFPLLPGNVRIMIPEIQTIAKNTKEFLLLVELAKSANTRNLIGSLLARDSDVELRLASIVEKTKDEALKKRIQQAIIRFHREMRKRGL